MYQQRPRYQARRQVGSMNYVMPFLILICVGIICILLFNLWRAFFPSTKTKAAYLHIVQGSAQMKAWGTDSFFNLDTDGVIMQGDRVKSSADAKFIVEFFDGTIMRMGGNADMSFDSIDAKSATPKIDLHLYTGDVWFNMTNKTSGNTDVNVALNSIVVHSNQASIFDLENDGDQSARVFSVFQNDGMSVDVMTEDGSKVIETDNIGVGQQIVFTGAVLKTYWAHQSPTVLAALSEDFKLTDWYLWNIKEDNSPTIFQKTVGPDNAGLVKVAPQAVVAPATPATGGPVTPTIVGGQAVDSSGNPIAGTSSTIPSTGSTVTAGPTVPASTTTPSSSTAPVSTPATKPATSTTVGKPVVTSVAGGVKPDAKGVYQVTSRVTTLSGTISGAQKFVVNNYTLTKFKPGDTNWSYFANADFGLMKPGLNTYEVYGVDAAGNKGESLMITVFYTPQSGTSAPATTTTTTTTQPSATTTTTPATEPTPGGNGLVQD